MPASPSLVDRIVDDLQTRHGCHTVILYGSRAAGPQDPSSDYDLLAIRESGALIRDARLFQGAYVDAFIHDEASLASDLHPDFLRIRGGVVLRQRGDLGDRLLARVREMFSRGPTPLPPDEVVMIRVWAPKMLERIARGDVTANYRRVSFLAELLDDYFKLRTLWYLGPKESLAWLEAHDERAYRAFEEALLPGAPLDAIARLAAIVVDEAPAPPAPAA